MKIRRNIFLFKLNNFFGDFWPLSALAIVYFAQITNSYATALGIFSIANLVQSSSEIPTGILSDKLGRKKTMIVSALLFTLCFILFALAGNLNMTSLLILGGIFWGFADSFKSGTDDALIYETMVQLRKENKYDIVYAASKSFCQIGLAFGSLSAAIIVYFFSINVLAWFSVLPALCHLVTCFFLIEPDNRFKSESATFSHFTQAFKALMKNKKLRMLSIIAMFQRALGYTSHRLEGVYFNTLIPTWLVNITRFIKQVSGAISYAIAPKIRHFGFFKILLASSISTFLIKLFGLICNAFLTPFIMSTVNLFYGVSNTAESALIQKELSQKQRATMGSIISFLGGIFSAIAYYVIGVFADSFSVYSAMILLVICGSLATFGYFRLLKKYA